MTDKAIDVYKPLCDRELKNRRSEYLFMKNNPFYDNIRSDPRFQEILAEHKALYEENLRKYGLTDQ